MDLDRLKKKAGINEYKGPYEYIPENPSLTADALKKKERDLGLKPGDQDWFKLWFSRPFMGSNGFRGRK
jgi:hypothetical protein